MSQFAGYHPCVNFIYFAVVLLISMFSMHPVIICISLVSSVLYSVILRGGRTTAKGMAYMLGMSLMVIVINPLFNHQGMTILFYFKNGNPFTMESCLYGVFMALLLISVIMWFQCYNEIMTTDKFIYLFGKMSPHLSLVISMTLRFVPRFKNQFLLVRQGQKTIGRDFTQGNVIERIRHFSSILSIMISWSMENSMETADSMKARGYGLPGRTAFSIYQFHQRDKIALVAVGILTIGYVAAMFTDSLYYQYFPTFQTDLFTVKSIVVYLIFGILCLLPMVMELIIYRRTQTAQEEYLELN